MITRKELINSAEYWQTQHEILCYRENIEPTLQLADKQEMIEKACEWFEKNLYPFDFGEHELTDVFIKNFRKEMER